MVQIALEKVNIMKLASPLTTRKLTKQHEYVFGKKYGKKGDSSASQQKFAQKNVYEESLEFI